MQPKYRLGLHGLHGLAMYLWRKVLLFSFNLLRQRHDISVLLFIVHGHALWRGRMSEFGPIRNHYHVHLVDHSARAGCSTFCCATPCWREPTSSKQLSTVAAFCWFSVWSLSCRCRVKFSTQSSLAEIWVIYIFGWLDLLQILRILAAFSLCGPLLIVCFKENTGCLQLWLSYQYLSIHIGRYRYTTVNLRGNRNNHN